VGSEMVGRGELTDTAWSSIEPLPSSAPRFERQILLQVTCLISDMAAISLRLHGVALANGQIRADTCISDDPLEVFRTFVTMVMRSHNLVES
jgi:hypothetical protein